MSKNQTLEKIVSMIAEDRDIDIASITRESTFEDLGLDSWTQLNLSWSLKSNSNRHRGQRRPKNDR